MTGLSRRDIVWPPHGEVMHKVGRGDKPLCGLVRGTPIKGTKVTIASWYASERWTAVTCKRCLAKRPKRERTP